MDFNISGLTLTYHEQKLQMSHEAKDSSLASNFVILSSEISLSTRYFLFSCKQNDKPWIHQKKTLVGEKVKEMKCLSLS
jgi:hypothetical protein